jgi:hypothetical protein
MAFLREVQEVYHQRVDPGAIGCCSGVLRSVCREAENVDDIIWKSVSGV